jgi:hypothetical protein
VGRFGSRGLPDPTSLIKTSFNHTGVQRLGCYKDFSTRSLPDLIVNLRNKIDWYDLQKTVRECACVAHEKGYKVTCACSHLIP